MSSFLLPSTSLFFIAGVPLAAWLYVRRQRRSQEGSVDEGVVQALSQRHGYGRGVRPLFALDFAFTHLNHASYGCAPYPVMRAARESMLYVEAYPDRFMRKAEEAQGLVRRAVDACAAEVFQAPSGSCAFVENATAGVNAVLRSLRLTPGSTMVITNHTYNACKNAINDTAERCGVSVVVHSVGLPLTRGKGGEGSYEDGLVEAWEATLASLPPGKVCFCLIDHITSPTAIVMPVARLVKACKAVGSLVMVDGAHSPGQVAGLHVPAMGADWFVGNLHKWCFTLKGVALLHAADGVRESMTQGSIISHFWKKSFAERFFMQGTLDYSRYLSAPSALAFVRESLGGFVAMQAYNTALVEAGGDILCKAWGTERMLEPYSELRKEGITTPFLVVVVTPLDWRVWVRVGGGGNAVGLSQEAAEAALQADEGIHERIAGAVLDTARVQSVFFPWKRNGVWCIMCRIAVQVYNTLEDYEKLAQAVVAINKQK